MNILQMEDMVKGLPDQVLMQEAQMPSGQIPQFLALSEVQRRQEMRQKLQAPPEATVADQILQGGIASAMPQQGPQQPPAPPQSMPQGQQMGPPQAPMMAYGGGRMPYAMAGGGMVPSGIVKMQNLGQVPGMTYPGVMSGQGDPIRQLELMRQMALVSGDIETARAAEAQLKSLISEKTGPLDSFSGIDALLNLRDTGSTGLGFTDTATSLLEPPPVEPAPAAAGPTPPTGRRGRMPTTVDIQSSVEPMRRRGPAPVPAEEPVPAEITAAPPAVATPPAAAPAAAPAGVAPDATAMGTPAPTDIASMMAATTGAMGPAYQSLLGMMPDVPRDNTALMALMPTQEQFDALKTDFSPFIQQVQQRGEERVKRYEESIKDIEERMKRERLGAVLTTLGSSLFAGEGAMGLEKAGTIAQQIGKEMRQEIGTERRAMEAARDTAADRALALQIQQVTSDKDAQREFLKSKNDFQKLVFQVELDRGKERRESERSAINLAANLATNTLSRLRTMEEQNNLNLRSFINAMGDEGKIINELLETSVGLTPEEKIKQYNTMMESRIRGYGALFSDIDVEAVISALKQKPATTTGATTQQSSDGFGKLTTR